MSDTIPTPLPETEAQRARRETGGETLVTITIKKRTLAFLLSLLSIPGGIGAWKGCSADQTVTEVKGDVQVVEQKAEQAKAVAVQAKVDDAAGYQETKAKLEPTGESLAELRRDHDQLRRDFEAERAQRTGRRARRVVPKPVPPEVTEPLPPTPAAAAAEATKPGGQ